MKCDIREQLEKTYSELNRQVIDAHEQARLEGFNGNEYKKKSTAARLLDRRRSNALREWSSHVNQHGCHNDSAAPSSQR